MIREVTYMEVWMETTPAVTPTRGPEAAGEVSIRKFHMRVSGDSEDGSVWLELEYPDGNMCSFSTCRDAAEAILSHALGDYVDELTARMDSHLVDELRCDYQSPFNVELTLYEHTIREHWKKLLNTQSHRAS